jgi:hypothetical protein
MHPTQKPEALLETTMKNFPGFVWLTSIKFY